MRQYTKLLTLSVFMIAILIFSLSYVNADGGINLTGGGTNFVDTGRLTGEGYVVQSSVGQAVSGQTTGEGYQVISNPPVEEPSTPVHSIYLPVVLK